MVLLNILAAIDERLVHRQEGGLRGSPDARLQARASAARLVIPLGEPAPISDHTLQQ